MTSDTVGAWTRDLVLSFLRKMQIAEIYCTMVLQILMIICTLCEKKTREN